MSDRTQHWNYPGARWWKFDFHTHTPASKDYGKGSEQAFLKQTKPRDWLLDFMRAEVDCVAVTDHNSGEWVDELKQILFELDQEQPTGYRPLYLFPGVEITAAGGTHILALFGVEEGSSVITRLLGNVDFRGDLGMSDIAADESPIDVVKAIEEAGGIPILAHVDGRSGAWELPGNTLSPLLDYDGLVALEVLDGNHEKPELYRERKLLWTEVIGSDSHHRTGSPGSRFPGSHYTWAKMSEPSLAGLRLALLDGRGFSIRRSDDSDGFDPFEHPKHCIESIEIDQIRFMGRGEPARLEFSPWLNALVGGRGTGKSTVIHALRLAARREGELESLESNSEPRLNFERFNRVPRDRTDKGGLTESTRIAWTLTRDAVRYRVNRQWSREVLVVEEGDDKNNWKPSDVQTINPNRFPVRIFSQGQIAALAGDNQQALLELIDEAAGVAQYHDELKDAQNAFYAMRARIRVLDGKLNNREYLVVEQQDVERKLKHFEEAGHNEILTSYRLRSRQTREIDRQFDAAENVADHIAKTAGAVQQDDLPDGLFDSELEEDAEVVAIIDSLSAAVRVEAANLRDGVQRLRDEIETLRRKLETSIWHATVDKAAENYTRLVDTLHEEGVADPSEYGRLVQDRQRLETELQNLDSMRDERDRLHAQSRSLLDRVLEARRAISAERDDFLASVLAQNHYVRIRIRTYGDDPRVIERSLRQALNVLDERFQDDILAMDGDTPDSGIVADLLVNPTDNPADRRSEVELRIEEFKKRIVDACNDRGDFGGHFNNYLAREFNRTPELLDKLLTWFPEDGLNVEYSRKGDGRDFRPTTQASAGQRSAAMLAFLLAHGNEPLVLDQPEDDLDNHLIYDLVVRQMKENKLRRQIIVVTHNPNIVVNGDAEMLHVLDFLKGQCIMTQSGSLQQESIREEVCRVMEGGREAFERRYRRLVPEPSHV